MFKPSAAFSGFSVNDIDQAKEFYINILGLSVEDKMGGTVLKLPNDSEVWLYAKENHEPATYTMLNFIVDNIDETVEDLSSRGISFEKYPDMSQDDKNILRGKEKQMGPNIAWFKDPAGNIISVLET